MNLYIDTADKEKTFLRLERDGKEIDKKVIKNNFDQAEKLLPCVADLFQKNKVKKSDLKTIFVNSEGDSFTALRIGVITANALAYGLNIKVKDYKNKFIKQEKFSVVKPKYTKEPNITEKKN